MSGGGGKIAARVSRALTRKSPELICSRASSAKGFGLPPYHYRFDRQLVRRQTHRLERGCRIHSFHLEQDPPGPDARDPSFGRALALTHPRLGRFFGERLVGENPDPDAPTALDMTRECDSRRFQRPRI